MWIPDPLYRHLPLAYGLVGLLLLPLVGQSAPGLFSALTFMAAAILTAAWRHLHRRAPPPVVASARDEWAQRRARDSQTMHYK